MTNFNDMLQKAKQMQQKMKEAHPKLAKEYAMLADIKYAAGTEDMESYGSLKDKYLKKT